ncbi:MAG: hypothetical protein ACI398_10335 [Clostridium sp.]
MKDKKYINMLIQILLVFSIILSVVSSFMKFIVTDKSIYMDLLEKSNTYPIVQQHLYKKMDSILGNDISEDFKKSIITEDDIKRESDIVLDCMLSNIINGQAVTADIDTSVYSIRIAKALASLTGYELDLEGYENNQMTYRDNIEYYFTPLNSFDNRIVINTENMLYLNNMNEKIVMKNIATRSEIEVQGRALLESSGYTEAEARKKLAEKGISEADVWQYLKDNGYLDGEEDSSHIDESEFYKDNKKEELGAGYEESYGNDSQFNNDDNKSINYESENDISVDKEAKISKKKIQEIVISVISDDNMNFEEKMKSLSSKLIIEAEKIIDVEMQKLNLSEIINSNFFAIFVKITSILYQMFYISLYAICGLLSVLLILNRKELSKSIAVLGNSVSISGGILSLIFGCVYLLKIYERLYLNFNKPYFEPMFFLTCDYFSKELFILSTLIFLLGILIKIQMMRKRINRR